MPTRWSPMRDNPQAFEGTRQTLTSATLSHWWSLLWPALVIALLRVGDVSLNVFRTVLVVQERRLAAAIVAGIEASVWVTAAGIVFTNLTPIRIAGFVIGVAAGTATGMEVARRLRLGMTTVRIYADATRLGQDGAPLNIGHVIAREIRTAGFGATVFRGSGLSGPVDMVLATVRRRDADKVLEIARTVDPSTFAAVDNSLHPAPVIPGDSAGRV